MSDDESPSFQTKRRSLQDEESNELKWGGEDGESWSESIESSSSSSSIEVSDDGQTVTGVSFAPIEASGGNTFTVTDGGVTYQVHAFTETGSTVFSVHDKGSDSEVDVLIVGGGGSGGTGRYDGSCVPGSGGGAGGLVFRENHIVSEGDVSVVVGDGGDSQTSYGSQGYNGEDSEFDGLVALGGGGGGARLEGDALPGKDGGSGGGGNHDGSAVGGDGLQPGSADGGFGEDGGFGYLDGGSAGCEADAGGGAGEPGEDGFQGEATKGGDGLYYGEMFGETVGEDGWFAGGGGMGLNYREFKAKTHGFSRGMKPTTGNQTTLQ